MFGACKAGSDPDRTQNTKRKRRKKKRRWSKKWKDEKKRNMKNLFFLNMIEHTKNKNENKQKKLSLALPEILTQNSCFISCIVISLIISQTLNEKNRLCVYDTNAESNPGPTSASSDALSTGQGSPKCIAFPVRQFLRDMFWRRFGQRQTFDKRSQEFEV